MTHDYLCLYTLFVFSSNARNDYHKSYRSWAIGVMHLNQRNPFLTCSFARLKALIVINACFATVQVVSRLSVEGQLTRTLARIGLSIRGCTAILPIMCN